MMNLCEHLAYSRFAQSEHMHLNGSIYAFVKRT
jgi:hypothetical protein